MVKELYGQTKEGQNVYAYTFENKNGMEMTVLDFGANLLKVIVPDKDGVKRDVVLACESLEAFYQNGSFLCSTVGPSANRIAKAEALIDGVIYKMDVNDGENNLHTDIPNGLNKRMWNVEELANGIKFTVELKDMEYKLPGNRKMEVTYTLSDDNEIRIDYAATSDKNTIMNPTNHTYFNLDGHESGTILDHTLWLKASHYTPVVAGAIPTGEIASVKGTPMDFTEWKTIGKDIEEDFEQLHLTSGFDHNFVVDDCDGTIQEIAKAKAKNSGITLTVSSDLPGVQFYAGNCIAPETGKDGAKYDKRHGFCLETQFYPDSVHHDNFPSAVFGPERPYQSATIFKFEV